MEKTLAKGLIVLEALIEEGRPCGVSELASSLGVSKSNVHRLLSTLVYTGFVASVDGKYTPSLKVWELGTKVISGYDVREVARPAMLRLVRETAEGVRLTVLDPERLEVVYIDKIDSPQDVRTFTALGGRSPAHCTSSGKVLLAYQDDEFIKRAVRRLKSYTKKTITSPSEFNDHLKKVRANGYAINQREYSPQVSGIAAPIFNGAGDVIAALSIAAPADRLPSTRIKDVAAKLRKCADDVTAQMRPSSASVVQLSERIAHIRKPKTDAGGSGAFASVSKRRRQKD